MGPIEAWNGMNETKQTQPGSHPRICHMQGQRPAQQQQSSEFSFWEYWGAIRAIGAGP